MTRRGWVVMVTLLLAGLAAVAGFGRRLRPTVPTTLQLEELRTQARELPPDRDAPSDSAWVSLLHGARIVGIGEGTHGNREFHRFQLAAMRALVEETGFRLILLEAPWSASWQAERFLSGGGGSAEQALDAFRFPLLQSDVMLDLFRWVHDFNAPRPPSDRIRLLGIDPQGYDARALGSGTGRAPAIVAQDRFVARQATRLAETSWTWLQVLRRDRDMFHNIEWALANLPIGAGAVLLAHNGHLAREWPFLGWRLARRFPSTYAAVASAGYGGSVMAFSPRSGRITEQRLMAAPPGSLERALHDAGLRRAWLPLRHLDVTAGVQTGWLERRVAIRSIGAALDEADQAGTFVSEPLGDRWDAVIFFDVLHPSRLHPTVAGARVGGVR